MPWLFAQSTFEFNLRLQEYIELVRARKTSEAIAYSRKYLTTWPAAHLKEIYQAMALLAFPSSTQCMPYKVGQQSTKEACAYLRSRELLHNFFQLFVIF